MSAKLQNVLQFKYLAEYKAETGSIATNAVKIIKIGG